MIKMAIKIRDNGTAKRGDSIPATMSPRKYQISGNKIRRRWSIIETSLDLNLKSFKYWLWIKLFSLLEGLSLVSGKCGPHRIHLLLMPRCCGKGTSLYTISFLPHYLAARALTPKTNLFLRISTTDEDKQNRMCVCKYMCICESRCRIVDASTVCRDATGVQFKSFTIGRRYSICLNHREHLGGAN